MQDQPVEVEERSVQMSLRQALQIPGPKHMLDNITQSFLQRLGNFGMFSDPGIDLVCLNMFSALDFWPPGPEPTNLMPYVIKYLHHAI